MTWRSSNSFAILAMLGTASLLSACILEDDVGSNDPDETGGAAGSTGGTSGTGGATGGSGGSTGGSGGTGGATGGTGGSTGGTGGSTGGTGGSTGGTGGSTGGTGGSTGGTGGSTGGTGGSTGGTGGSTGGTGGSTGGTGGSTGGTGGSTGGTGGGTGGTGGADAWQTLAVSYNAHTLKSVGSDIVWSTMGDVSSPPGGGGMYKVAKTSSWTPGTPIIQGDVLTYMYGNARSFVVDGNTAFVWETILDLGYSGSNVLSVALPSGGSVNLFDMGIALPADIPGRDQVLAVDDTWVYYPCEDYWWDDGICRGSKDGTGDVALVVADGITYLTNIALTPGYVYWTTYGGTAFPGSLNRAALGTIPSTVEHIADLPEIPTSVVTDGADVYVFAVVLKHGFPSDPPMDTGTLFKFVDGQGPGQELVTLEARDGRLAADATHLYFADGGITNDIHRISKAGGAMTTAVTDGSTVLEVGDVEVDATHIYWIAEGTGSYADLIRRAPKP